MFKLRFIDPNALINLSEKSRSLCDMNTPIFDQEFALNQFSGNRSLLIRMLEKFISQYESLTTILHQLAAEDDRKGLKMQVHTVKGVSGNLGLTALHLASKEFELFIEKGTYDAKLSDYCQSVEQGLSHILKFTQEDSFAAANSLAKIANPQQSVTKQKLIDALDRNEFITQSKLANYLEELSLSNEQSVALKAAINALDYPSAKILLLKDI